MKIPYTCINGYVGEMHILNDVIYQHRDLKNNTTYEVRLLNNWTDAAPIKLQACRTRLNMTKSELPR